MRAEDLMVGDWVICTYPSINKPVRVAEIKTVADNKLKIVIYDDDISLVFNETYIDPIPLTPEILEKNGFKYVSVIIVGTAEMRWVSEDTRTEITIWMDDTLPMEIVKNVYYEDEVSYTLPFPGTVHQLQHALRLCGIDKQITL